MATSTGVVEPCASFALAAFSRLRRRLARTQSGDPSVAATFKSEGYSSLWEVLDSCLTVEDLQDMGIDPASSAKVANSLESMTAQAEGAGVANGA